VACAQPSDEEVVRKIFNEALTHGAAYANLQVLTEKYPGRLAGSQHLEGAILWAERALGGLSLDRVYLQDVLVPHWERGAAETACIAGRADLPPLAVLALGDSAATPRGALIAPVVEVRSLAEVEQLGRDRLAGKIVFFNRPMDPTFIRTTEAYHAAADQRFRGPAQAARFGAAAALVRSLTFAADDVPHAGMTGFPPEMTPIPCAALGRQSADRLSAALQADPTLRVVLTINARRLPDAPSHNVIGEIRGRETPDEILVVGAHLDSWDNTPGAHDDGAGVVQAMEVLRLFRALGLQPRHTLRCVIFTNEENGSRGATAYAAVAKERGEKHLLALESDAGGFVPRGFELGGGQGAVPERAAGQWRTLFEPYGISAFTKGNGGADVAPLQAQGAIVGELVPDSQRYFDYHHAATDTVDQVNRRELELGAAALAALIWLVDTHGL
jgi:hypothetical protein